MALDTNEGSLSNHLRLPRNRIDQKSGRPKVSPRRRGPSNYSRRIPAICGAVRTGATLGSFLQRSQGHPRTRPCDMAGSRGHSLHRPGPAGARRRIYIPHPQGSRPPRHTGGLPSRAGRSITVAAQKGKRPVGKCRHHRPSVTARRLAVPEAGRLRTQAEDNRHIHPKPSRRIRESA